VRLSVRLAAALLCAAPSASGSPEPPDTQELAGRRLYHQGVTPSGEPLRALVGAGNMPLSGAAVACGNCHGADGRGRPEAGVLPPDITWAELTKPYGHTHGHRKHGAFGQASFARAVNEGLDPQGNRLDAAMPRYALSRAELAVLTAYLERLAAERDPGIGEERLRLGTILPVAGPAGAAGKAMRAALEAYFETLNRAGGLHQRRIELVVAEDLQDARKRFTEEPIFALVSPFVPRAEEELGALIGELRLASVESFTAAAAPSGSRFHVFAGSREQAAVLAEFAGAADTARAAILYSERPPHAEAGAAAARRCEKHGCADALRVGWHAGGFDAAATVRRLKAASRDRILFFGTEQELARLLEEAGKAIDARWRPGVYALGELGRSAAAARERFAGKLYLAFPTSPLDRSPEGERAWRELRRDFDLSPRHQAAQLAALTAAAVLVEGVRRAGRGLSREGLLRSLEGLSNFGPGFGPPVSYGPGRRIGARGGYVVALEPDRGIVPASGWISLN
jgi:ABC-type branched-subunit amino acid transport system substrate-binding protein